MCLRFLLLFGALIHLLLWYLDPREKTQSFNNTLLRTTRNSYNKTTLVRNRHKESKRAWLRQKQQTEIDRHRKSKKGNPCTYSSGDAGSLCGCDCQNKSSKKCLTICSNIQTGSWRFPLPLTVSGVILKYNGACAIAVQNVDLCLIMHCTLRQCIVSI